MSGLSENMREIVRESVLSVKKEDLKRYKKASLPSGLGLSSQFSEKQIGNAIAGYASNCKKEDIVVMFDNTFGGSGKKGMVFSTEGFYCDDLNVLRKKCPLPLPVRYQELQAVEADGGTLLLHLKDGRLEKVFGSIYSGFIAEALNRIVERISKEEKTAGEKAAQPEPELAREEEKPGEAKPETEDIFGCIWAEESEGREELVLLNLERREIYQIYPAPFSQREMETMRTLVYFAAARIETFPDGSRRLAELNRLESRYIKVTVLWDEITDTCFTFADSETEEHKYRIRQEILGMDEDELYFMMLDEELGEELILSAVNKAGAGSPVSLCHAPFFEEEEYLKEQKSAEEFRKRGV